MCEIIMNEFNEMTAQYPIKEPLPLNQSAVTAPYSKTLV